MADVEVPLLPVGTVIASGDGLIINDASDIITSGDANGTTKVYDIDVLMTYIDANVTVAADNLFTGNQNLAATRSHQMNANSLLFDMSTGAKFDITSQGSGGSEIFLIQNTGAEILSISDSENIGIGKVWNAGSYLNIENNTTTKSSFRLESSVGVDVAAPVTGDTWWNGTNLYFYDGTVNNDLLAGAGGTTINTTDNYLPVRSNATTFIDSLLSQTTGTVGTDLTNHSVLTYLAETSATPATPTDAMKWIYEYDGAKGIATLDGLTGGLLTIIDDKDNELWTASDVSGNPIGYIDADWLVQFGNPFNRPFELVYNSTTGDTDNLFNSIRYNMLQLVDYADDTAAGVGGLVTGDLYRTTATKAIAVKD